MTQQLRQDFTGTSNAGADLTCDTKRLGVQSLAEDLLLVRQKKTANGGFLSQHTDYFIVGA